MTDLEWAKGYYKRQLLEGKSNPPNIIATHSDGTRSLIAMLWDTEEQKSAMVTALRVLFAANDVVSYVFASEAWMRKLSPMEMDQHRAARRAVSNYDDKIEILIVLAVARESTNAVALELVRDASGSVVDFKEAEGDPPTAISGRMTTLLPPMGKVLPFEISRQAREAWSKVAVKAETQEEN